MSECLFRKSRSLSGKLKKRLSQNLSRNLILWKKKKATLRQRKLTEKASKRQKNVVRNVKRLRKTIFMSWSLML